MTLATHEFIRRFLIHFLPKGFHRIRHYGLFANTSRAETIAHACALLNASPPQNKAGKCRYRRYRETDHLAFMSLLRRPDDHH